MMGSSVGGLWWTLRITVCQRVTPDAQGLRWTSPSKPACEQQHDDDDHYQAKGSAWAVSPTLAVRPRGKDADQYQNEHDQENGS